MTACWGPVWESTPPGLVLNRQFGRMVALRGMGIVDAPLSEAVGTLRTLDLEFMREAAEFFKYDADPNAKA